MILYTSGTTGPSKGVLIPHAHCFLFGLGTAEAAALTPADRYFICMPLFHANALLLQFVGSLIAGAEVAVAERFRASTWLAEVRAAQATVTNGLGVIPEFIFRQPPTDRDRDHRLRLIVSVPIAEEWGHAFESRFGVPFMQLFGMTECNIVAYTRLGDALVPGCAGYLLTEWFDVRIVDPDRDVTLPPGRVGEIAIRPKVPGGFMAGYFRMPDRTVEAWRNLWFHTGDAGRLDDQGRLHFVDRIKDCIRRRGENISSFEVERGVQRHPDVLECAVVGRLNPEWGEEVMAFVVARPDGLATAEALDALCLANIARFKRPKDYRFIDSLPKNNYGKILKTELRRLLEKEPSP